MALQKTIFSLLIFLLVFSTLFAVNEYIPFMSEYLLLIVLISISSIAIILLFLKRPWESRETFAVGFTIITLCGLIFFSFTPVTYDRFISAATVLSSFLALTNYAIHVKKNDVGADVRSSFETVLAQERQILFEIQTIKEYVSPHASRSSVNPSPIVGSIRSERFHLPHCLALDKVAKEDHISFPTLIQARAQGYRPCKRCLWHLLTKPMADQQTNPSIPISTKPNLTA